MPNALIIGISDSLGHELNVRDSFLTYAPNGWGADILMGTENESLADNEHVVHTIEMGGFISYSEMESIRSWVSLSDYDIIIFSYYLGAIDSVMEAVVSIDDKILFMPLTGASSRRKNNIIYCGVGSTENTSDSSSKRVECYDKATLLTSSWQLTPSYVTPAIASKCAYLLDDGLTNTQARQALRYSCSLSTWDSTDGFGKVPSTLTAPDNYPIEPVNNLRIIGYASTTHAEYNLFEGQSIDSVRLYMDDTLLYDGNGTETILSASSYAPNDSRVTYRVLFDDFSHTFTQDDEGEHVFSAVAVKDGVESSAEVYSKHTYTLTQSILQSYFGVNYDEESEAPEVVEEEVIEEAEEAIPVLATPTPPSLARSSETVTVTPNETATTLKLYRKTRIEDDWELVGTTTESTISDDTTDADKNYIYAVKIANSETESDYSEPAYIAGNTVRAYSPTIYL
jgi:hypothetical protein